MVREMGGVSTPTDEIARHRNKMNRSASRNVIAILGFQFIAAFESGSIVMADRTPPAAVCDIPSEEFDSVSSLGSSGWVKQNNSQPGPGSTGWFQGDSAVFAAASGASDSYIAANYNNGTGVSTLSNWLLTPPLNLQNGSQLIFWT